MIIDGTMDWCIPFKHRLRLGYTLVCRTLSHVCLMLQITRGLQKELNRLYAMFCARHPYFEDKGGKVSTIAHSLGIYTIFQMCKHLNMDRFDDISSY